MYISPCKVLWVIQGKTKTVIVLKDFDILKRKDLRKNTNKNTKKTVYTQLPNGLFKKYKCYMISKRGHYGLEYMEVTS